MREFVIRERTKPKLVRSGPGLSGEAPVARARPLPTRTSTVSPRRAVSPRREKKRGQRQFVVAYGGAYVGFFEAESEITPREAFVRVAADLGASDDAFDPEQLEIYKPVLLRGARPANGCPRVKGKLKRIGGSKVD